MKMYSILTHALPTGSLIPGKEIEKGDFSGFSPFSLTIGDSP